jgi:predicted PurR-regulated permease PerM
MERGLGWSRRTCSAVLVLGTVAVLGGIALVVAQAMSSAVSDFGDALPGIVDGARHSGLGDAVNVNSGALDTLREHTSEIVKGVGDASGGIVDVGVSAFGAVAGFFSVLFLTLYGLIDEPRIRGRIAGLLYPDKRERVERVAGRIVRTTSRYMLGNLVISVICGTVYGVMALILGLPYPLALAVIGGLLDLVPVVGATVAGAVVALVALSVGPDAMVAAILVVVVYQQIENYVLQPAIIGRAAQVSSFTVLTSVLVFGALFGVIGAIIGVPVAAAFEILADELTAPRRARVAAAAREPVTRTW